MNTKLNANQHTLYRAIVIFLFLALLVVASRQLRADTGSCGGASITLPFTDVPSSNGFFCAIASAYFSGLTNGTSATTYTPSQAVPREQMAAFVSRTLDQSLKRGNLRAVTQQWWQPANISALRDTNVETSPTRIAFDGTDLWVANSDSNSVSRVRASEGVLRQVWDNVSNPRDVIVAAGYVFVTSLQGPGTAGRIYRLDPTITGMTPSSPEIFESNTGPQPVGITFDGQRLWTANISGSITRVVYSTGIEATFTVGFVEPADILWDGENLWVADFGAGNVKRVDPATGTVSQFIQLGGTPSDLLFDGANLWVSNPASDSVTVIRAVGGLRGTVLDTITGNGLNTPRGLAFDGERVLVCNSNSGLASSVSLFKASDFTPLGNLFTGVNSTPIAACSDGLNFWIVRQGLNDIVRF